VKYANTQGDASKYLEQAFYYFIALQPDKAEKMITAVEKKNN